MSDKGSVFQKGGGGTNFEQYVQSAFLTTLIIRGNAPSLPSNTIREVAFQTTRLGYQTDDLYVLAKSNLGIHRVLVQIKHNLTISENDAIFKEVILAFWQDYSNEKIFNHEKDRLLIIKGGLNNSERNHVKAILNFAKSHATETDFIGEINRVQEKKDKLAIFRNVLKEVAGQEISDNVLWSFLKCLDLLEYDFLHQSSVDETYFLNLIKLAKDPRTDATEKDIWNDVLKMVTLLNKDGGNVTIESIQKEEIFTHFNYTNLLPVSEAIDKLRKYGDLVLKPLRSDVRGHHVERTHIKDRVVKSISEFPITIITGKPGVGKSAIVKDILTTSYKDATAFVFRADQFNKPHLGNVFTEHGITASLQEVFSCLALVPEKILVIDSLEKLLEGDPENAFKQLLAILLEYRDIRLVTTCRHYAVDLIIQKFGVSAKQVDIVEVGVLDDDELLLLSQSFPLVADILENKNLKKLLRSPKYLEFAIDTAEKVTDDLKGLSLTEFKHKLWMNIVENNTLVKDGMPIKRSKAFSSIAIKRAGKMMLYVEPDDNLDLTAIDALERDEIIFKADNENAYAPAHDILEDWALVRYIESKFKDRLSAKHFFDSLGNEPAIRRGFRLWIEDVLVDSVEVVSDLIQNTLTDNTIENYWVDELLVAVFRSDESKPFFQIFKDKLLENGCLLLNKCIHLLRTACKESHASMNNANILIPVGSGWEEILVFISVNLNQTNEIRYSILNLLFDWQYNFWLDLRIPEAQLLAAKRILFEYLGQIESKDEFWSERNVQPGIEGLVILLFDTVAVFSESLDYIARSIENEDASNKESEQITRLVVNAVLSSRETKKLSKIAPELIIKTAWKKWKLVPRKFSEDDIKNTPSFIRTDTLRTEECWGIKDRHGFFPSGIYKTPFYNVLNYSPSVGLEFFVEFINYSVEFYSKAKCDYKHKLSQITIILNDGTKITQWGCVQLWNAYRGLSVTHYLLESLLMSLELFLLNTAKRKTKVSKANIKYCFEYLLRNSNNVAITGVLCSVAMAYPEEVEEWLIPLLTVKEHYSWDLDRSLHEHSAMSPHDQNIPFAQKARYDQNKLPHRSKFFRGLRDFIIDYQFNVRTYNKEIFGVFDQLKSEMQDNDLAWKKILIEIDIRNHRIGEYDEKLGGFTVLPHYDEEVNEFIESGREDYDRMNHETDVATQIGKVFKKEKSSSSFDDWKEWYGFYTSERKENGLFDRPVSLSIIGLRDFRELLDAEQKSWCLNTIFNTIGEIVGDTINQNFELNTSFNLFEKEIAMNSFHWLLMNLTEADDIEGVKVLLLHALAAPFHEHEMRKIVTYLRGEFALAFPDILMETRHNLIRYSKFRNENKKSQYYLDEQELQLLRDAEIAFVSDAVKSVGTFSPNVEEITFDSHDADLLCLALLITPDADASAFLENCIDRLIKLIIEDLLLEEDYSYNRRKNARRLHSQILVDVRFYIADLLLTSTETLRSRVADQLLNLFHSPDFKLNRKTEEAHKFVSSIFDYTIYLLDETKTSDEMLKQRTNNFWSTWHYLSDKISKSGTQYFITSMLLDTEIAWSAERDSFIAFENHEQDYLKILEKFGNTNARSLIRILSTIGDQNFLPRGLFWISKEIRNNVASRQYLISTAGERLAERLFYKHILTIKSDQLLVNEFLRLLSMMVDLGSSKAYFFRENTITYKHSA